MKLHKWMIAVAFLGFGLSLYGQQIVAAPRGLQSFCSARFRTRPARPISRAEMMDRLCKSVQSGIATPASSPIVPTQDDSATYIIVDVGTGGFTQIFGMSASGAVTGLFGDDVGVHGFLRDPQGKIVSFDAPGSMYTNPIAINDEGTIIGYYCDDSGICRGFVRNIDGTITTFDIAGNVCFGVFPGAIDPDGTITGGYYDENCDPHGFVRDRSGTITIFDASGDVNTFPSSINPRGEIAGSWFDLHGEPHGFVRDRFGASTIFDVPGGTRTAEFPPFFGPIASINPKGEIAGAYFQPDPNQEGYRGFLRKLDGTFETFASSLDGPCCTWTWAIGLTPDGTIAGYQNRIDNGDYGRFRGYVRGHDGSITLFDAPGAGTDPFEGTYTQAINPAKVVAGFFSDPDFGVHGFLRIPQ